MDWRRSVEKKVPEVTVSFWLVKVLTTAMGEATSDYSVHKIDPVIAVLCAVRRLGACVRGRPRRGVRHVVSSGARAGTPHSLGGLDWGRRTVSIGLTVLIVVFVAYLSVALPDVPAGQRGAGTHQRSAPA
jgi:uncharacterized membrane-anchored protein